VIIDVEKLFASPLAAREGWKERRASNFANQPLIVPPGTSRLAMGALLDSNGDSAWQASVMEFKQKVPMDAIARGEQGAVETVADRPAVLSPIDVYFIELDSRTLAAMTPANRQAAARWIKGTGPGEPLASAHLRAAGRLLNNQTSMVMAIDMEDLLNESRIQWRIENEEIEALKDKKSEAQALAALIAGVKGLTLTIGVTDKVQGNLELAFGGDTAMLSDFIKPLLIDVLNNQGMSLPDLANWKFTCSGNKVTATGELTPWSLARLASIVDSPTPVTAAEPTGETPSNGVHRSNEGLTVAEASLQYYQSISSIIENFEAGATLGQSAGWLRRQSQRINKMPILNVDPELLAWGNAVATSLMEASAVLSQGQREVNTRASENRGHDYGYYGYYGGYNGYGRDYNRDASRSATQQQKSQSMQQAQQVFQQLLGSRNAIRQTMTERYKVEFN
jgi:hypothetical protein